jgi:hypothetical protein
MKASQPAIVFFFFFFLKKSQGPETHSDFPRVTQLIQGRAEMYHWRACGPPERNQQLICKRNEAASGWKGNQDQDPG